MKLSVGVHTDRCSPAKPPRPPPSPRGKKTRVTGTKIGRGGAKWYRRGHFTQRSFQEVSHQDAGGVGDGKIRKEEKKKISLALL